MLKTIARWLAVAVVLLLIAPALFGREGTGWRWLTKGGWHTTARISSLTPQERTWAQIARRYVENNTQPHTGSVNGSDKQPRATLWQMGDTLIALLAARELGLVKEAEFDARLTPLLGTLNRLTLTDGGSPGRLYSTQTATPVDFSGKPAGSGWSAKDMARLMLALRLTAERAPQYGEYIDKIILRWNFCPVIDKDGELWSASLQNGQRTIREELRLGDSEYAASAFRLWGFPAGKALSPARHVIIYQRRLTVDDRDPRTTGNPWCSPLCPPCCRDWSSAGSRGVSEEVQKLCAPGRKGYGSARKRAGRRIRCSPPGPIFRLPGRPARGRHRLGNGYARNTLGDDGKYYPGWRR